MADDLDENYQLDDEFMPSSEPCLFDDEAEEDEKEQHDIEQDEPGPQVKNNKQRPSDSKSKQKANENKKTKKKNITEILKLKEKELNKASFATREFKAIVQKHINNNLSSIEKTEFNLIDETSGLSNLNKFILKRKQKLVKLESFSQHFNTKFNFKIKSYLNTREQTAKNKKHTPFMIILCSSAIRCIEIQKDLDENNKYFKSKKICWFHAFAKHKKLNDQIDYLTSDKSKKKNIDIVYATPQRLAQLIEANCFDLSKCLKYVLIDYTHRDVKLKRFVDQNDIKQEFFFL